MNIQKKFYHLTGSIVLSENFEQSPQSSQKSNESKTLEITFSRKSITQENKSVIN